MHFAVDLFVCTRCRPVSLRTLALTCLMTKQVELYSALPTKIKFTF